MKLSKNLILAINTYMAVKWINDGWFLGKPSPKDSLIKNIGKAAEDSNISWALSCGTIWLKKDKCKLEISGPILPDGRIINRDEKGIAALKSMLSVL